MRRVPPQHEASVVALRESESFRSGGFIVRQQNFHYMCLHKALGRGAIHPAAVSLTEAQSAARPGAGQDHNFENVIEGIAPRPQGGLQ